MNHYAEFQLNSKSWKKYDLIKLPNRSLKSEPYKFWNRSTWLDTRQRGPMTITDGDGVQEEIEGLSPDSLKNWVVEFFIKASHQNSKIIQTFFKIIMWSLKRRNKLVEKLNKWKQRKKVDFMELLIVYYAQCGKNEKFTAIYIFSVKSIHSKVL